MSDMYLTTNIYSSSNSLAGYNNTNNVNNRFMNRLGPAMGNMRGGPGGNRGGLLGNRLGPRVNSYNHLQRGDYDNEGAAGGPVRSVMSRVIVEQGGNSTVPSSQFGFQCCNLPQLLNTHKM